MKKVLSDLRRLLRRGRRGAAVTGPDVSMLPADLLALLHEALHGNVDDSRRFQIAEALGAAVYPHYKFSEFGRVFLDDEEFIDYYRRFMDPGNWHSLDRKYLLNEFLKQALLAEGDAAECGTYKGATAYLICRALDGALRTAHLFDSFQGLSPPQVRDGSYWKTGALCASPAELARSLQEFDNYRVYAGWIPQRFEEVADRRFCFVHVDVDLYAPTLEALQFFYPRLTHGAVLLMDDYGFSSCPGARDAADEFFADKPEPIVRLPTGQAVVMRHSDVNE